MVFDSLYANRRFFKKGLDKLSETVEKYVETVENSKNIVFTRGREKNGLLKTFPLYLVKYFFRNNSFSTICTKQKNRRKIFSPTVLFFIQQNANIPL